MNTAYNARNSSTEISSQGPSSAGKSGDSKQAVDKQAWPLGRVGKRNRRVVHVGRNTQ
jgi:hypothetical protein